MDRTMQAPVVLIRGASLKAPVIHAHMDCHASLTLHRHRIRDLAEIKETARPLGKTGRTD